MFSIITVTYNSLKTLKDSYYSLSTQSFTEWEWVVQDGGSSDDTIEWLNSISDSRVKWISEPDYGIYDALNKALKRANGEWIGLLHSDDFYPNNNILKNVFDASNGVVAIYGDLEYVHIGDLRKVVRYWQAGLFESKLISQGWMPPHPTLFLRKEIYKCVGPFDTEFKIAADYDFILRVFRIPDMKVEYLPIVFMRMRQGGASSKFSNLLAKSIEDIKILKKNGIPNYRVVVIRKISSKLRQFILKSANHDYPNLFK
jgi:glycosyltransferase